MSLQLPTPVQIPVQNALSIIENLPPHLLQGRRLFEFLSQHPKATTGQAAFTCSIGNLSEIARQVNPHIHKYGLMIACEKPPKPIPNKFGEKSAQYLWSVYQISEESSEAA